MTSIDRTKISGIVGLFRDSHHLTMAAKEARTRHFKYFDCFSPFPVHGLEEAMGIRRSKIPWITLLWAIIGCLSILWFQIWTSAVDWPLIVGGKPYNSLAAFIPPTFEVTVLLGGVFTFLSVIAFCRLPRKETPLGPDITNDRFAIFISSREPRFNEAELKELLQKCGAYEVRSV